MYFLKFLYIFPLKSKARTTVTSAFKSILKNHKICYTSTKLPIWVRTDKGKEFFNRHFQDMLNIWVFRYRYVVILKWGIPLLR